MILNDSYGPLLRSLPLSLVDRASQDEVNDTDDNSVDKKTGDDAFSTGVDIAVSGGGEPPAPTRRNGARGTLPPLSGKIPFSDNNPEISEITPTNDNLNDGAQQKPGDKQPEGEPSERYGGLRDFTHPALDPARIVWIPQDTLGLGEEEARDIRSRGIDVATRGAYMNEKGAVDVDTYPPGEKPLEAPAVAP